MRSLFRAMRSFGQIYWQAVLSCALQPAHFSVITYLGMLYPPVLLNVLSCFPVSFYNVSVHLTATTPISTPLWFTSLRRMWSKVLFHRRGRGVEYSLSALRPPGGK